MTAAPVGVALVGVGAFGEFCLAAFREMPEVLIAAVVDTDVPRAEHFAKEYGARAHSSLDAALEDEQVEVVALNTPPYLHGSQGLAVLRAGKHLFCEKPLALTLAEGDELLQMVKARNVHLTVDYVMRRNALWEAAAALRESGVLGKLLHMDLANHAAGLNLPPQHWFWDKTRSGGIWIEHGVHFFDAFSWVAGTAGVIDAARQFTRDDGAVDRVEALARYGDAAAHFYHGFDQSSATEQTTVRLTFEQGYLSLHEWVPTRLELLTPVAPENVERFLPGSVTTARLPDGRAMLRAELVEGISAVYRQCIQDGMRELTQAVRDPSRKLNVTGQHGMDSLRMAVDAEQASTGTI